MDPQGLVLFTAIGVSAAARITHLAIDIRLDGTAIAGRHVLDVGGDSDDFDAEFVTWDARIAEEGHFTQVSGQIGATNADTMNAHQRLARARAVGRRNVKTFPMLWGFQG